MRQMVCLRSAYFIEIEIFLLKVWQINIKVNWNSIIKFINSIEKCSRAHK